MQTPDSVLFEPGLALLGKKIKRKASRFFCMGTEVGGLLVISIPSVRQTPSSPEVARTQEDELLLMDKILHDPKDPKLWELWYIPYYG